MNINYNNQILDNSLSQIGSISDDMVALCIDSTGKAKLLGIKSTLLQSLMVSADTPIEGSENKLVSSNFVLNYLDTYKGNKGDRGTKGDKGDKGAKSTLQGPRGTQGNQCTVRGETGDKGAQGLQGPMQLGGDGPRGDQGNRGAQGPQGAPGLQYKKATYSNDQVTSSFISALGVQCVSVTKDSITLDIPTSSTLPDVYDEVKANYFIKST